MSVSALNSFYAYFPTDYIGRYAAFDYLQSTGLELGSQSYQISYIPTLFLSVDYAPDRIEKIDINLNASSAGGVPESLSCTISLTNFKLPLDSIAEPLKSLTLNLTLQNSSTVEFAEDELFNGSIGTFKYSKPSGFDYCEMKEHFKKGREIIAEPGKGRISSFQSLNKGEVMYVLFDTGNFSVYKINKGEYSLIPQNEHRIPNNLICTNWAIYNVSMAAHCS